jgi:prophage regulatory protein
MVKTKFINKGEVVILTSLSQSTLWRMERKGQFPKRIQISTGRVAWYESEVTDWMQSRILVEKS